MKTSTVKPRSACSVTPVRTAEELQAFIDMPWKIYAEDPMWVPPIKEEVREILTEKNPFWQHAERQLFLAQVDGEIVGRCAAIVDRFHNEFQGESCGFFGFFECIQEPDIAKSLFDAVADWLKSKGMTRMRGPASPSFNEECGVLIEGFDDPPLLMMAYNPPYYRDLVESAGFVKVKDLYSYFLDSKDPIPKRIERLSARVMKKNGVRIRHLSKATWDKDLRIIRDIYNDAWEKNWGFTPMTPAELDYMIVKLKPIIKYDLVHFTEIDGETAAFSLLLPDVNQALRHLDGKLGLWGTLKFLYYSKDISRVRLMALGVRKRHRNKGFEIPLYREAWIVARRRKCTGDLGWILEDNFAMNRGMKALESKVYKKYRIFEREIR